ncbi:MAG: sugar phosphate isomerase/epimerase [ANME-2 cluster archaeon]|nr:sugar phosphate isomerase/epimerase [ANME-2 cluster archaeon]
MIIGASSFASTLEELIAEVDSVELYVPKMGLYEGRELQHDRVEDVRDILSTSGGITSVHAPYYADAKTYPNSLRVDMAHMNGSDFRLIEESIEMAVYFQSNVMVVHPGLAGDDRQGNFNKMIDNLKRLSGFAEDHGIVLGLENKEGTAPGNLCCEAAELVMAVEEVNSGNLGVTFDVGHANLTSGGDSGLVRAFMKRVREWVVHVHVHDNMGVWTGEYDGDIHMAPGTGTVDLSVISELGCGEIHNLEVFSIEDVISGRERLLAL